MRKTALLLCLTVLPVALSAEPLTITRSVETGSGGMRAILAVADYATGFNLRAAFICLAGTPGSIPPFVGCPGEPHPVQLYMEHNGNKTTFPPVLRGPRTAGCHSPQISSVTAAAASSRRCRTEANQRQT